MSHCSPAGKRGGKRPGAGAPKGNLNALKHGQNSAQLRALLVVFHTPAVRDLLTRLLDRRARRNVQLQQDAAAVGLWLRHLGSNVPPPIPLPPLNRRQVRLFVRATIENLQPAGTIKQNGPQRPAPRFR